MSKIRFYLIKKLCGKDAIAINFKITANKGLERINKDSKGYIYNCHIIDFKDFTAVK